MESKSKTKVYQVRLGTGLEVCLVRRYGGAGIVRCYDGAKGALMRCYDGDNAALVRFYDGDDAMLRR